MQAGFQAQPMKNTIYLIQYSMLEHLLISSIYLVESDALFFATTTQGYFYDSCNLFIYMLSFLPHEAISDKKLMQ